MYKNSCTNKLYVVAILLFNLMLLIILITELFLTFSVSSKKFFVYFYLIFLNYKVSNNLNE